MQVKQPTNQCCAGHLNFYFVPYLTQTPSASCLRHLLCTWVGSLCRRSVLHVWIKWMNCCVLSYNCVRSWSFTKMTCLSPLCSLYSKFQTRIFVPVKIVCTSDNPYRIMQISREIGPPYTFDSPLLMYALHLWISPGCVIVTRYSIPTVLLLS